MRKILFIILAIIVALSTSGYRNEAILSEMTIAQGLAIDKDKNETKLTVQYLDLSKGVGTTDTLNSNISSIIQGNGKTISTAVTKVSSSLSSTLYFGQNRVIVFGKDYCENDFSKGVDYILRGVDSRVDVLLAMSEKNGEDIIKSSQNKAKVPAEDVYETLKSGQKSGYSLAVDVNDLLNLYSTQASDIYLPILKINSNKSACDGIAIFSGERLVSTIKNDTVIGFLAVQNELDGGTLVVRDSKLGTVGLEIASCKAKNHASLTKNGVLFSTKIKLKLNLNDVEKGVTTRVSDDDIARLEELASKKLEKLCEEAVLKCFENKSDPFMFNKLLNKYDRKAYKDLSKNWRGNLAQFNYKANVKSKLQTINNSSSRG